MNIYEKLLKIRVDLQGKKLKKTGNNKFAGYTYYELGDFLPTLNKLCLENKIVTITTFDIAYATLTIIDAEKPEDIIEFTSPMAEASLKGCHAIQNIGAVETYQRRYLMMLAFEIVESDALDATTDKPQKNPDRDSKCVLSQAQIGRLFALGAKAGYVSEKIEAQVVKKFNITSVKELTKEQYDQVTKGYEQKIAEKGEQK